MTASPENSRPQKNKYLYLFEDSDVKRWYDNLARGSPATADVYLRRVGSFCEAVKMTPKKLASLSDLDLYHLLLDQVTAMEKKGDMGSYIESAVKCVKSWLGYNGKEVRRKIKIMGARDAPSLREERVPTKDELRRVLLQSDSKTRTADALVALAGLRLETLGDYKGKDGLIVCDLPEMKIQNGTVTFDKKPTMIIVRGELSKAKHQYFSFLTEEGCEYVKDYLEERMREGEVLNAKSPIITPKLKMKSFIRTINIGDNIRIAMRAAGLPWRPYVLRCYFDTQLMLAESKGLVLRDYRQFWMGHKGDIENRYTTNKQKLPEAVVEDMRGAYARSEEFLQTKETVKASEDRVKEAVRKQLLLVAGLTDQEVGKMDLSSISDEELQGILRRKLLGAPPSAQKDMQQDNAIPRQKVIKVEEAETFLDNGWQFVSKLTEKTVVVSNGLGTQTDSQFHP